MGGPTDVVRRQSFRAEAGTRRGDFSAPLLWESRKYYEQIGLGFPWCQRRRHGFPLALASFCIRACASAR
eukprot:345418-Pyramimonas_sp.AAC.1